MSYFGRLLCLAGAVGVVVSAFLPWVDVQGAPLALDLLGGTEVSAAGRTVSGTDTSAWPVLLGVGALAALLAVLGALRRLLVALGVLTVVAGAALVYYVANVIDIETSGRPSLERIVAHRVVVASPRPGPFVLLAAGAVLLTGASAGRARRPSVVR